MPDEIGQDAKKFEFGDTFGARVQGRYDYQATNQPNGAAGPDLFLAAILDLYSRFIVGWAVSAVNDRHLTIKATAAVRLHGIVTVAVSLSDSQQWRRESDGQHGRIHGSAHVGRRSKGHASCSVHRWPRDLPFRRGEE